MFPRKTKHQAKGPSACSESGNIRPLRFEQPLFPSRSSNRQGRMKYHLAFSPPVWRDCPPEKTVSSLEGMNDPCHFYWVLGFVDSYLPAVPKSSENPRA